MLFDHEQEIEELNYALDEPGSHFLMVLGRRRLGKTTLLVDWSRLTQRPTSYWVASRISSARCSYLNIWSSKSAPVG
jgi:predicted AAA+ superfamily ATPase